MEDQSSRVVVTDIQLPFWSMVTFMVKWVIASIPAFLILMLIGLLASSAFSAIVDFSNFITKFFSTKAGALFGMGAIVIAVVVAARHVTQKPLSPKHRIALVIGVIGWIVAICFAAGYDAGYRLINPFN